MEYHEGENDYEADPRKERIKTATIVLLLMSHLIGFGTAEAHKANHREVVTTQGTAACPEDERLVPVRHHGYNPERTGGWVYVCFPWENKRRMAP